MKLSAVTSLVGFLLFGSIALAHDSGHGSKISELGPEGGRLSSVVLAKESEKGRDAKSMFLSETRFRDKRLTLRLLTREKKMLLVADKEAKLILFFKSEAKPRIIKVPLVDGKLVYHTEATDPALQRGELIFNHEAERYVTDISL